MARLWLLDVFIKNGETVYSLYDEGCRCVEEKIGSVDFYGYIEVQNPEKVAEELKYVDGIEEVFVDRWRKPPFYTESEDIVVFKTKNYRVYKGILRTSSSKGLKPLNTFPHPLVEALYRANVKPLTLVKSWSRGRPLVSSWSPEYGDPEIDYVVISFRNGFYFVETSRGVEEFWNLKDLVSYIKSNRFLLGFTDPYIYTQMINVDPDVGRMVYRWVTGGPHNPSEYFEWSRLSYTPLNLMKNTTIGRILTTIEALIARDRRYIVDRSYGRVEPWRPLRKLVLYDRGGVVYQPKPRVYWSVCQVDFRSLYPNIMVKYNVSGETIDKPICSKALKLPWVEHSVCLDDEGIVPLSIKKLIEIKDLYELLAKKLNNKVFEHRRNAVKWILVASFGYLGYRNSLFGSVMAHEVVTSTGREILMKARVAVEEKGYRVVHAIVDSLFIEGVENADECEKVKDIVEEVTGFKAKVEAHFTWLYIPRLLNSNRGASNKYYGLLSDNGVKIKGVLAVRSDTPPIVKKAQLEAIEKLFKAKTLNELTFAIEEAHKVIDNYVEKLRRLDIDLKELVITRYAKVRERYRRPPEYVLESLPPYRLVYTKNGLRLFKEDVLQTIDVDKYVALLEKARKELPSKEDLM